MEVNPTITNDTIDKCVHRDTLVEASKKIYDLEKQVSKLRQHHQDAEDRCLVLEQDLVALQEKHDIERALRSNMAFVAASYLDAACLYEEGELTAARDRMTEIGDIVFKLASDPRFAPLQLEQA